MHDVALKLAVVAAGGILAQWVAWRTRLPAIVLLLVGGFVLGPLTGWLDPAADFGAAYRPVVSIAVAIILFEGGLTLNVAEIRETSKAVRRLILLGGPLVWGMTALAAHFVAGLSWPTAAVLGAILVVTGPTVVMPLLRQAHLAARPASLLRWEAIVNDAIGALFAVIAFETFLVLHGSHGAGNLVASLAVGMVVAVGGGYAAGTAIEWAFTNIVLEDGFTLAPFATLLGLTFASKPGILIVGGSPVTAPFAATLKEADIPVMIADTAWSRLREARLAEIPVCFGEILSEEAHYDIEVKRFAALIATTSNDAYNALVCTNLGPEIGRANVFEIPTVREQAERKSLSFTLGGRPLTRDPELRSLDFQLEHIRGWGFQATRITEEFSYQDYLDSRAEGARVILWRKPAGKLVFRVATDKGNPEAGDLVISFAPPRTELK